MAKLDKRDEIVQKALNLVAECIADNNEEQTEFLKEKLMEKLSGEELNTALEFVAKIREKTK